MPRSWAAARGSSVFRTRANSFRTEMFGLFHALAEGAPFKELHRDEESPRRGIDTCVVDLGDSAVADGYGEASFTLEASEHLTSVVMAIEHLDRRGLPRHLVARFVNRAHPSTRDQLEGFPALAHHPHLKRMTRSVGQTVVSCHFDAYRRGRHWRFVKTAVGGFPLSKTLGTPLATCRTTRCGFSAHADALAATLVLSQRRWHPCLRDEGREDRTDPGRVAGSHRSD